MKKKLLFEVFKDKLPVNLGKPYIVVSRSKPYVFCAFYDARIHELGDGRVINGNEFRFWQPRSEFDNTKVLAGIIGIDKGTLDFVCCALTDYGTRAKDIAPVTRIVRKMMLDIATNNIGSWTN